MPVLRSAYNFEHPVLRTRQFARARDQAGLLAGSTGAVAFGSAAQEGLLVFGKGEPMSEADRKFVIGQDDRVLVSDTTRVPWRYICCLEIRSKTGGRFIGTGWLASPSLVITAGHCVFEQSGLGGWADSIDVVPARNGNAKPFGAAGSTRFACLEYWNDDTDDNFDVGCIFLDQPFSAEIGYFGARCFDDNDILNRRLNIAGFPEDRAFGTQIYFHSNLVRSESERRLRYDVDTWKGQSGSPIWIQTDETSAPVVVGIHTGGEILNAPEAQPTADSAQRITNSGIRLTQDTIETIACWNQTAAAISGAQAAARNASATPAVGLASPGIQGDGAMSNNTGGGNGNDSVSRPRFPTKPIGWFLFISLIVLGIALLLPDKLEFPRHILEYFEWDPDPHRFTILLYVATSIAAAVWITLATANNPNFKANIEWNNVRINSAPLIVGAAVLVGAYFGWQEVVRFHNRPDESNATRKLYNDFQQVAAPHMQSRNILFKIGCEAEQDTLNLTGADFWVGNVKMPVHADSSTIFIKNFRKREFVLQIKPPQGRGVLGTYIAKYDDLPVQDASTPYGLFIELRFNPTELKRLCSSVAAADEPTSVSEVRPPVSAPAAPTSDGPPSAATPPPALAPRPTRPITGVLTRSQTRSINIEDAQ